LQFQNKQNKLHGVKKNQRWRPFEEHPLCKPENLQKSILFNFVQHNVQQIVCKIQEGTFLFISWTPQKCDFPIKSP
jgi:hypothetical protein